MVDNFPRAEAIILLEEGVYSNDPADPGAETKWGIARAYHPEISDAEWAAWTVEKSVEKYRTDYWLLAGCDTMPWCWALVVFNYAVNLGVGWATHHLAAIVSPKLLDGLDYAHERRYLALYQVAAVEHYETSPNYGRYKDGWLKRTFEVLIDAMTPTP